MAKIDLDSTEMDSNFFIGTCWDPPLLKRKATDHNIDGFWFIPGPWQSIFPEVGPSYFHVMEYFYQDDLQRMAVTLF